MARFTIKMMAIFAVIIISYIAIAQGYAIYLDMKEGIAFPFSSYEIRNLPLKTVKLILTDAGFTNINIVRDYTVESLQNNPRVLEMAVDGNSSFKYGDKYLSDVLIVIFLGN